jgi:hypothetical protein
MKTTKIKYENDQFAYLYCQVASVVNECLPFGMKEDFGIDLVAEILELEDVYMIEKNILGTPADPEIDKFYHKDMIRYIVEKLNSRRIFPTCSDIEKILELELNHLVNTGICCKMVA